MIGVIALLQDGSDGWPLFEQGVMSAIAAAGADAASRVTAGGRGRYLGEGD
jgi:hypothetical protein